MEIELARADGEKLLPKVKFRGLSSKLDCGWRIDCDRGVRSRVGLSSWHAKDISPSSSLELCCDDREVRQLRQHLIFEVLPFWNLFPGISFAQAEQKICPHTLQWWRRLKVVNGFEHLKQVFAFSSFIQNSFPKLLRARLRP